ncbi:hypothetical protein D3C72_1069900 [compost metagenome]
MRGAGKNFSMKTFTITREKTNSNYSKDNFSKKISLSRHKVKLSFTSFCIWKRSGYGYSTIRQVNRLMHWRRALQTSWINLKNGTRWINSISKNWRSIFQKMGHMNMRVRRSFPPFPTMRTHYNCSASPSCCAISDRCDVLFTYCAATVAAMGCSSNYLAKMSRTVTTWTPALSASPTTPCCKYSMKKTTTLP